MFSKYISFIENLLSKVGLNENVTTYISEAISLITLIVITLVLYHAVLFVIRKTIYIFIEKSDEPESKLSVSPDEIVTASHETLNGGEKA